MKLLMITRKADWRDVSSAAFALSWVKKIGKNLEKLYVITWQESNAESLPEALEISSLSGNKLKKVFVLWGRILKILPKVDGVFCHQNPEYTILAAPLVKLFNKKVVAWYTHKAVNWKLHLVNFLADKILTASEESCRLKNRKKIEVVGHGIDIDKFKSQNSKLKTTTQKSKFIILSVGRISPVKDYETLIKAIDILVNQNKTNNLEVQIVGGAGLKGHERYFENLKKIVSGSNLENYIKFIGPIPHYQIVPYYQNCDLFINLSQTGSVDKAVLEAMACEKLVLTSNEAFVNILENDLIIEKNNPKFLAGKIKWAMSLAEERKKEIQKKLRAEVVKNHNLDNLVFKIISQFNPLVSLRE